MFVTHMQACKTKLKMYILMIGSIMSCENFKNVVLITNVLYYFACAQRRSRNFHQWWPTDCLWEGQLQSCLSASYIINRICPTTEGGSLWIRLWYYSGGGDGLWYYFTLKFSLGLKKCCDFRCTSFWKNLCDMPVRFMYVFFCFLYKSLLIIFNKKEKLNI